MSQPLKALPRTSRGTPRVRVSLSVRLSLLVAVTTSVGATQEPLPAVASSTDEPATGESVALRDPVVQSELRRLRAPVGFDRVDFLAEDTGAWVNYELPVIGASTVTPIIRFAEQVKVSVSLPVSGLYAGLSLASQSVNYEYLLLPRYGLGLNAGVHTKLLLPRGVFLSAFWRFWRTRIAVGVSVTSATSWAYPDWTSWVVLPTVGLGIGRSYD